MKLLRNYVLIKPDATNTFTLSTGNDLYFDNRFEEQKAAPQSGTVIAVPEKLTFSHNPGENSLDYQTDMELIVGDRVIFNYNAKAEAMAMGMVLGDDFFVRYDMIYVAVRDESVICVNGTVIVEPENEEFRTKLFLPEYLRNKVKKTTGIVKYASKTPHHAERFKPELNTLSAPMYVDENEFKPMKRYVKPGDRVLFHFSNAIPLQHYYELHGVLSKTMLYRMKHTDIECVMSKKINLEHA